MSLFKNSTSLQVLWQYQSETVLSSVQSRSQVIRAQNQTINLLTKQTSDEQTNERRIEIPGTLKSSIDEN